MSCFRLLALAAALAVIGGCSGERVDEPHPIIILDIDTLRADHLGCYGYPRDTSPNIDALAAESFVFDWALSQAPNTPPSQASIMSSLYPSVHGMINRGDRLPEQVTTLAEALAAHGLRTAGFVDGGFMGPHTGIGQGFEVYSSSRAKGLRVLGPRIMKWLRQQADEAFLLLIHTYDVHTPYAPPEPFRSMFLQGLEAPTPGFEPTSERLRLVNKAEDTRHPRPLADNDLQYAKALYDGEIRYVDDWIGRFLERLGTLGILDRATIVLLSDHGEEFQEHGALGHSKLYSTVTRIPLLIRPPGGLQTGRRVPDIVESIDVMPTLLELAGAEPPPGIHGRSLVPLMRGEKREQARAFGESPFHGGRRFAAFDRHQLLWTQGSDEAELYDLAADPRQQSDLSAAREQRTERMRGAISNWQAMIDRMGKFSEKGEPLDPAVMEQLRALGYVD